MEGSEERGADPASAYLNELRKETMRRAWGEEASPGYRRRIVLAAIIFGEQFQERAGERPREIEDTQMRRFLMGLMNAAIGEFARREGLSAEEAASFLGDVGTRDRVLEFNEVLNAYRTGESARPLDELLRKAVESRTEKAIWSEQWSSG